MTDTAYKILAAAEWRAALAEGRYEGSAVDLADGYIHMSTGEQLVETARRHYAGRTDLVLLTVDLRRFGDELIWEPSRGGDLFPHLYAPLPAAAVTATRAFAVADDGAMIIEDGQ
ncbi:DUF952 domain-containing protein [Brevundimonas sp. SL130]|uniref:DUF952 domain-containing protein n=1 Tax=Brevundimonas sp. SL130 TaxID=2995143 RepID=UPI00226C9FFC|nr:DUF952 domain-containing protein [Brevundimonas sp. SL130]WAC60652.1 DUF952 domain-containing protein [Brevundimonas sp. SL130]